VFDAGSLLASAVVGGIVGAAGTAYKSRKDLEGQYDIALREKRVTAYAALWTTLEPLAMHFGEPLTYADARALGVALRTWYYHDGGLVLSESTRAPYFNLQQALQGVVRRGTTTLCSSKELDILQALASRLRTATTQDVATRLPPRLRSRIGAPLRRLVRRARPIRVSVDRRWRWDKGKPKLTLFAIIENRSDSELSITGAQVGDHHIDAFRLQPGEDREVDFDAPWDPATPMVTAVRVDVGRRFGRQRRPAVPLPSSLVERLK
jgi:hypothetical protein